VSTHQISIFTLTLLLLTASAFAGVSTKTGTLADGSTYLIEVPSPWNGTLLLYSHELTLPGQSNPARDVSDSTTGAFLLANGFALAGSSFTTGWAIKDGLVDQIALLDVFTSSFGTPTRTIAWGHGLGGIISAGLIQNNPTRFAAAVPMCADLAGTVGAFNRAINAGFTFKTLLASNTALQVVHITDPTSNVNLAEQILAAAQSTAQGRARLSLVFAMGDSPGWFDPSSPEPATTDFATREANQFLWARNFIFPIIFGVRAELESRAGGNGSWNTGIDYKVQFSKTIDQDIVTSLYAQAGLDLNADLDTLNNAQRISNDPAATQYMEQNIFYNGNIQVPVMCMHTSADGLMDGEQESAYADVVREAGNNRLLRQIFVHRAGHCSFTPAENITALQTVIQRLDSGHWPNLDPTILNSDAAALGSTLNTTPSAFFDFAPAQYLRPFDAFDAERCSEGIQGAPGSCPPN